MKTAPAKLLPLIMGVPEDHVLTQAQFLLKFQDRHRYPAKSRPFCFILGAGASIQSGIPGAKVLIDEWLPDLHRASGSAEPINKWAPQSHDRIKGYSYDHRTEFYSQLYALRFRDCEDDGALFLQDKMKAAQPSYGYAVLAQLLGGEHRVVLTTNFDSLASDAVFQFGGEAPFICGHESLASFIPAHHGRPVIVKLHRDLLTGAINDPNGTSQLHNAWRQPVRDILQRFTPVFIGYGGNDGSLMDFLEDLPDGTPDKIYWCQYKKDPPIPRVAKFLSKDHRYLIPIDGFDQLMSALHTFLGLPDLLKALEDINQRRLTHLRASQASLTTAAEQDLAETTAEKGPDSPESLAARFQLAVSLYDQGRYADADAEHHAVLLARRRTLGPEHPDTLASWHQWGRCLLALRVDSVAETEYRKLTTVLEQVFGPEHPVTLNSRNNLAISLKNQWKIAEARSVHATVLSVRERVLGADHPDTLWSRHNLAKTDWDLGIREQAESEFRQILTTKQRILFDEDPSMLAGRYILGVALCDQRDFAAAENELRTVVSIQRRLFGPLHPDTLRTRGALATVNRLQGKNSDAKDEYVNVMIDMVDQLGPEHPDTLTSRENLALALQGQWKNAEAEAEHRAVLAVRERVLGPEHPDTLTSRNNLANALGEQGKNAEEEAEHRAVLAVRERVLGPEHPDTLLSHYNLSLCLESLGNKKAAQKDHKKARRLWVEALCHAQTAQRGGERVLGAKHPQQIYNNAEVKGLQTKLSNLPPQK